MKILKRLISAVCTLTMIAAMLPAGSQAAVYSDLQTDYACYASVERLSELGIINGYEDDTYRPWNSVTRAEFCKIIVAMLDKMTEAQSTSSASAFDDVNKVSWCVPYVNYLTDNNVIKGYADATFKPNNIITYAEAVTILCRILGYNEETVGYSWPANYLSQARALKLAGDMEFSANDSVTRAAMAIMADNALFTNTNGSSQVNLLESVGFTVTEDTYIIADKNSDSSLKSDELRLTDGKYTSLSSNAFNLIGRKGTAVFNEDKELVLFVPEASDYMLDIVVTKVADNTVEYKTKNGIRSSYTLSSDFEIYYGGAKTTFGAVSSRIQAGTSVRLFSDEPGDWDFAMVIDDSQNIKPVRAAKDYTLADTHLEGIEIDYSDLTVYKDNKTVTVADIEMNDVIYYNTQTNTMDVYSKKITGIYKEALPSKAYVESVNVGGNIYQINSRVSTSALDASQGSFALGDRITLLLGENDEVCFAVELGGVNSFDYGIVLKTYRETSQSGDNEGSSQIMASVFMADGNTYEYETKQDYKNYIGDLVKLDYADGIVSMNAVSSSNIYGEINRINRTIGGKTLLKDAVIFNRINDENDSNIQVEVLDFDTISISSVSSAQLVTSVSANAFGDIAVMYLCDLPESYNYGLLKNYESMGMDSSAGVYTIYSDSNTVDYQSDSRFSVSGAIAFKLSGNKIVDMKALYKLASSNSLQAAEDGRIMINGTIYKMSDNVEIVDLSNITSYRTMSVKELSESRAAGITVYSDKSADDDPTVRLVTVTAVK